MKHRFKGVALAGALALAATLCAQNTMLMPVTRQTFWSTSGKPLAGAR